MNTGDGSTFQEGHRAKLSRDRRSHEVLLVAKELAGDSDAIGIPVLQDIYEELCSLRDQRSELLTQIAAKDVMLKTQAIALEAVGESFKRASEHLQHVLNGCRSHHEQVAADAAARAFLSGLD